MDHTGALSLLAAAGPRNTVLAVVLTLVLLIFVGVSVYYARYRLFPNFLRQKEPLMPREANGRLLAFLGSLAITALFLLLSIWWRWIA